MDIFKHFDIYNLKARVFPALIAGLPTLALLFVIVPWDHLGISHAIAGAMGFVLLFAFADLARHRGKTIEAKLASNATPKQWHRGNPDIPEGSKDRFRAFIAVQLKLTAPTAIDEQTDPHRADDFYLTANAWIRDRTRDARIYNILFAENVTYGHRRNLLGLKPIGLLLNIIVLTICAGIICLNPSYFVALSNITEKLVIIIIAVVLHSVYLLYAVNKKAVFDASRVYGRQLILSCDTLMKKPPAAPRKAKAGSDA